MIVGLTSAILLKIKAADVKTNRMQSCCFLIFCVSKSGLQPDNIKSGPTGKVGTETLSDPDLVSLMETEELRAQSCCRCEAKSDRYFAR